MNDGKIIVSQIFYLFHASEISLREAFERQRAAFCVSLCYILVNNGFEGMPNAVGFSSKHASKCFVTD